MELLTPCRLVTSDVSNACCLHHQNLAAETVGSLLGTLGPEDDVITLMGWKIQESWFDCRHVRLSYQTTEGLT